MRLSVKKILTCVLVVICLFLVAFVGAFLYGKMRILEKQRQEQAKIDSVKVENPDMPEEYRELKADNQDVCGWISIEGTEISYPILQNANDNSYYLNHDASGAESESGAIFIENYNSPDFSDFLTVLYGNRMDDGSMFGELLEYEDPAFFEKHRNIRIFLPDRTIEYYIFATYVGDNSHLLLKRDLSEIENRNKYISEIFKQRSMRNNLDKAIEVSAENNILALSTGYPSGSDSRFIVQAVRK